MEVLFALWDQPTRWMLIEPSERSCKNRNKTKKGCASVANRPRFGRGKPAVITRRTEATERVFAKCAVYKSLRSYIKSGRSVCEQSSGAVWKTRWTSWAPVPNKPTVSVDVKQHFNVCEHVAVSATSYGFCGRKATLNNKSTSRAQELCESRGGRPGLPSLINLRFLWT